MKFLFTPALIALSLVSNVVPVSAHHVWPVNNNKLVTVKGTVVDFDWANPASRDHAEGSGQRWTDGELEGWRPRSQPDGKPMGGRKQRSSRAT